jgi:NADP-dependent 3-hydroxy acid dehydrogenase YdfG
MNAPLFTAGDFCGLAEELTASSGNVIAVGTDVTHCEDVKRLVDTAVQNFGRIGAMINNTGLMPLPWLPWASSSKSAKSE